MQKEGTHPIVYPAAGSHATFYDSAVYIQNGQRGSGVGCDNTTEPLRELRPRAGAAARSGARTGPFEWLSYRGRWGEREKGFNNGPTGPQTKTVWREPFAWMEKQRTTSPRLPGGSIVGPTITGAFCGAVAAASDLINLDAESRPAAIATIAVASLLLIGLFVGLTSWGPIDLDAAAGAALLRPDRPHRPPALRPPLAARWSRSGWPRFPIVGGANLLAGLLGTGSGVDDAAGRGGVNLALGDLVEAFARPAAMAARRRRSWSSSSALLVESEPAGFRAAWRGHARALLARGRRARCWSSLGVFGLAHHRDRPPLRRLELRRLELRQAGDPLRRTSRPRGLPGQLRPRPRPLVAHRCASSPSSSLVSIATGPVLTFALIFTALPLLWINLLGSLVFALLIPYVALGETLLYFDLEQRGRGGAGEAASLLAALAPAAVRSQGVRADAAAGRERIGCRL